MPFGRNARLARSTSVKRFSDEFQQPLDLLLMMARVSEDAAPWETEFSSVCWEIFY